MFDWDDKNIEHIARHGIEYWEVEEALGDADILAISAYNRGTEKREGIIGMTEDSRILVVIYTMRGAELRPVTARDANKTEKKRYRKGKR